MLKLLGRLERTRNIIITGFAILMAVGLIFFYAPGRSATNIDATKNTEVVAKVGSKNITVAELARMRDNMMQRYGGMNLGALGGNRRFLDILISQQVIVQEAERDRKSTRLNSSHSSSSYAVISLKKKKTATSW